MELGRPVAAHGVPELAEAAVKVVLCPAQIVLELADTVGAGSTVTKTWSVAVQPLLVPVTVYVVVALAVKGVLFVMPLSQE
jgi:hypothetical protein